MRAPLLLLLMLVGAVGLACAMTGCASGADGVRQACANTDGALEAAARTTTAAMKQYEHTAQQKGLAGCFVDLVSVLDSARATKEQVCANPDASKNFQADVASAMAVGNSVADALTKWQSCTVAALKGAL